MKQYTIRFVTLFVLGVLLSACASTGTIYKPKVTQGYDRFADATKIQSSDLIVKKIALLDPLKLSVMARAFAICPGNRACRPEVVGILFSSSSETWAFLHYRELVILADGERLATTPERAGSVHLGGVTETLSALVDWETFTKIATAETVEVRLGIHELNFSKERREAFRLLVDHLENNPLASN